MYVCMYVVIARGNPLHSSNVIIDRCGANNKIFPFIGMLIQTEIQTETALFCIYLSLHIHDAEMLVRMVSSKDCASIQS